MTYDFGKEFRIHIYGESHGEVVGVIVEGCPPGLDIDIEQIQREVNRRRPGIGDLVTSRSESDQVRILSGVYDGKATGAPISMTVSNNDVDSSPYKKFRYIPRPGHADYTARVKYSGYNDYRGGGTFSGRMTVSIVMAGSIARSILNGMGIQVVAHTVRIGSVMLEQDLSSDDIKANAYVTPTRCANIKVSQDMESEIASAQAKGDSVGGIVECRVLGVPVGLGEPFFDSIESILSHAMFSIPGVKGIEFGSGFRSATMLGSENNDSPIILNGHVSWTKNDSGGILGGISNGAPVVFRVAIKPASSIAKVQQTIDLVKLENTLVHVKGRHDSCIVPRAVPVVEGLAAVVTADLVMRNSIRCCTG
jgi:chorismate synthase